MTWSPRRRYLPRNVELARQGYRELSKVQDLHPLHEASGRNAPGCPRCQAGAAGQPSPTQEETHRGE
jgi:hypothetical protein